MGLLYQMRGGLSSLKRIISYKPRQARVVLDDEDYDTQGTYSAQAYAHPYQGLRADLIFFHGFIIPCCLWIVYS